VELTVELVESRTCTNKETQMTNLKTAKGPNDGEGHAFQINGNPEQSAKTPGSSRAKKPKGKALQINGSAENSIDDNAV